MQGQVMSEQAMSEVVNLGQVKQNLANLELKCGPTQSNLVQFHQYQNENPTQVLWNQTTMSVSQNEIPMTCRLSIILLPGL